MGLENWEGKEGICYVYNSKLLENETALLFTPNDRKPVLYEAADAEFDWLDISAEGVPLNLGDDNAKIVALPFPFSFYGNDFKAVSIGSNGLLSFEWRGTSYRNSSIPSDDWENNIIAPFWDDLNPRSGGQVYYLADEEEGLFVVQYHRVPFYGRSDEDRQEQHNTFQVVLRANGGITFQYLEHTGRLDSATVGLENSSGGHGTQLAYNAAYVENRKAVSFAKSKRPLQKKAKVIIGGVEQEITYTVENGLAIYQGDMVIGETDTNGDLIPEKQLPRRIYTPGGELIEHPRQAYDKDGNLYDIPEVPQPIQPEGDAQVSGVGVRDGSRILGKRWYSRKIPYRIASEVTNKAAIRRVLQTIRDRVGLDFWETDCNPGISLRNNYIQFRVHANPEDGRSYVGRQDWGATNVDIGREASDRTILHEVGHALGLYHEHSRSRRDRYVTIQEDNIDPYKVFNFGKVPADAETFGAYDYDSIMHYHACAYSKKKYLCGRQIKEGITVNATIVPYDLAKLATMGGEDLSSLDIRALQEMYSDVDGDCPPGQIQVGTKEVCDAIKDVCKKGKKELKKTFSKECYETTRKVCRNICRWLPFGRSLCRKVCKEVTYTVCYTVPIFAWRFACEATAKVCEVIPHLEPICVPDPTSTCY